MEPWITIGTSLGTGLLGLAGGRLSRRGGDRLRWKERSEDAAGEAQTPLNNIALLFDNPEERGSGPSQALLEGPIEGLRRLALDIRDRRAQRALLDIATAINYHWEVVGLNGPDENWYPAKVGREAIEAARDVLAAVRTGRRVQRQHTINKMLKRIEDTEKGLAEKDRRDAELYDEWMAEQSRREHIDPDRD